MGHLAELDPPQIAHARPSVAREIPQIEKVFRLEDPLRDGLESVRPGPGPIETLTVLIPRAAAEAVWWEASVWLDEPLPKAWIPALAARADAVFEHNDQFRKLILGKGCSGRDWLWVFMRHWLSGILWRHRPDLHDRLPSSYGNGHELPEKQGAEIKQARIP